MSDEAPNSRREFDLWVASHMKEHDLHHREHELAARADEKASSELDRRLQGMNEFREALREAQTHYLTIERFEREHRMLVDRVDANTERLNRELSEEHTVTAKQEATQQLIEKLSSSNRWMVALLITSGLTLISLALHVLNVY